MPLCSQLGLRGTKSLKNTNAWWHSLPQGQSQQPSSALLQAFGSLCQAFFCPLVVKQPYGTHHITKSLGVLSGKPTCLCFLGRTNMLHGGFLFSFNN